MSRSRTCLLIAVWAMSLPAMSHDSRGQGPASSPMATEIPPPELPLWPGSTRGLPNPLGPHASPPPLALPDPSRGTRSEAIELPIPPLSAGDQALPVNLAASLRLAGARPLVVAAAEASVWVAEARYKRARLLWVPSLMFGFDYIRHDGGGPDFNKGILTAPSANFFYGGASAIQVVNLSDAIYEPLAARRVLNARHADVQTSRNDALLATAEAYFSVHEARGRYAGSLYAIDRGQQLVDRVSELSRDLVPRMEVSRAENLLAELQQLAAGERRDWQVKSADLTQVLRLDPRAMVQPVEPDHLQITLIDPRQTLDQLTPISLANRPELASHQALIDAASARITREKMRPALPIVMLNGFQSAGMLMQAGIFGLGPNSSMDQWTGRADVSIQLLWQLDAFGAGNRARIKQQRGEQSRSIVDLFDLQDRVVAEVTRAHAEAVSTAIRVEQADRALRSALLAFNGTFEGLRQTRRFGDVLVLINRPQEAVYSLYELKIALDNYYGTVGEYNRAQFRLYHALGYPADEVALARPPGDPAPVDTSRPGYLPPVGVGPPPATR